jgi:uncharacterized protein (UPF0147 family)
MMYPRGRPRVMDLGASAGLQNANTLVQNPNQPTYTDQDVWNITYSQGETAAVTYTPGPYTTAP